MRAILPVTVTDAILTSSTAAEPGPGETAWNGATAYSIGDTAYLASNHTIYQRVVAGTTATSPDLDPTSWLEVGPTNRWRSFDLSRDSQTTVASPYVVVLTPGVRVNSIAVMNMIADAITVEVSRPGVGVVYTYTQRLLRRNTLSWSDYFFGTFSYQADIALFDLPPYVDAIITITLTRSAGAVACGGVTIGNYVYLGEVELGAEDDALNFSTIDRNFDGTSILVRRRSVPKVSLRSFIPKENTRKVRAARDQLNAVPVVWAGLDDPTDDRFESLLLIGVYKRFTITHGEYLHDQLDFDLEGF